jgi:DNA polymerase
MGATAEQAVLGPGFRLMQQRGVPHALRDGTTVLATVHPSWVLRQSGTSSDSAYAGFLEDLRLLAPLIAE